MVKRCAAFSIKRARVRFGQNIKYALCNSPCRLLFRRAANLDAARGECRATRVTGSVPPRVPKGGFMLLTIGYLSLRFILQMSLGPKRFQDFQPLHSRYISFPLASWFGCQTTHVRNNISLSALAKSVYLSFSKFPATCIAPQKKNVLDFLFGG